MEIKGKADSEWSDETVYLMDILGRYSRLRRAGLRLFERVRSLSSRRKEARETQEGEGHTVEKKTRTEWI